MKTCDCGGMWYRHGEILNKRGEPAQRYQCKECRKSITVRNGEISHPGSPGSPRVRDWRTETTQEART